MQAVHTETYKGFTIEIHHDEDAANPFKDWDGQPDIIGWHRHYDFNTRKQDAKTTPENFLNEAKRNGYVVKTLYAYEHGGIAFSTARTGQFTDVWDSGTFGFIFWTPEKIKSIFSPKNAPWGRLTAARRRMLDEQLDGAVELLNDYAQGRVYGFVVKDAAGAELDSCWGFYGSYKDNALIEAKSQADYHAAQRDENDARKLEEARPDMYRAA